MNQENPNPPPPLLSLLRPSATIASPTAAVASTSKPPPAPSVQSPRPITRSEPDSPYPTTFVQADPSTFKQVVQMLTGSSSPRPDPTHPKANPAHNHQYSIPPLKTSIPKKPQQSGGFRLYERRNSLKKLSLNPQLVPFFPAAGQPGLGFSPRKPPEILSPSLLDFPSLTLLSPVTPLMPDPFAHPPELDMEAEDRAIKEKGFFLHPSPRGGGSANTTPEPRLLPLFPVTSSSPAPPSSD